jgi:predicted DNA-binding protein
VKKKKNYGNSVRVSPETKKKLKFLAEKNTRTVSGTIDICVDYVYKLEKER